jgi:cytochrome c-type biogenesis protein CcmH
MVLWILFALMTGVAILAVVWPLGHVPRTIGGGSDVVIYKDQLREIDHDRAAGLIGETEAEAARLEVSRRLLAAAATAPVASDPPTATRKSRRYPIAAVAAVVVLAFGPLGLYVALGSPNLPGEPALARVGTPRGNESIATLVSQVEAHLASNPSDGTGWELLAPIYMRLGRFDDAVEARKKALTFNGETATRDAELGEAQAAAANGVVTAEAKASFERAVARDPKDAKARYYLGVAAQQDGNPAEAAAIWRALLADAPSGAQWVGFVREALAQVSDEPTAAPGPSADQVAAASTMTVDQRRDMARGMVARLADRLHDNSGDVDGWLRLVRAYVVLGDRDKARAAAADAKRALSDQPDAVKRIDDLVKGLGLEG